jgi:AcrR family transcriptional regulator
MGIQERRTELRQQLRDRILEVSREIVAREGFGALSMRRIAEAISYSPASLYLHFEGRADIARALREEGHTQLLEAFAPHASIADPVARLRSMGRAYVEYGLAAPQTYRMMFGEPMPVSGANERAAPALAPIVDAFIELRAAGRLPREHAPLASAEAFWAMLHGMVALRLARPDALQTAPDALVDLSLHIWFDAMTPAAPRHRGKRTPT